MKKKILAWILILIPALYFLIYSVINLVTYFGTSAKVGAGVGIAMVIIWLIGDMILSRSKK